MRIGRRFIEANDVTLFHGDCVKLLRKIPDASVRLVITSPPYNVGKEYEQDATIEAYLKIKRTVIEECVRITRPGGSICWQVGNHVNGHGQIIPLDILLYPLFAVYAATHQLRLRNRIVWHFEHGLHCKNRFSGSDGQIAAPVASRLYLPEKWASDPARRQAAGGSEEVAFQTKPALALDFLKQVLADGVSPAPVLGDEVYGAASELRWGLRPLGLEYFLNAGGDLLAWTKPVKTRLAKKYWGVAEPPPESASVAALSQALNPAPWPPVAWRAADGPKRKTRIAWLAGQVWSDLARETGERPQTWLVVDWPEGDAGPDHLSLAWFKTQPNPQRCLRLSRGRFPIEQFFQRAKTDLGLDRYEGRAWPGFHHHRVLAAVADLFVLVIYLRSKKNFWCYVGTGVARDAAVVGAVDRLLPVLQNKIRPKIT